MNRSGHCTARICTADTRLNWWNRECLQNRLTPNRNWHSRNQMDHNGPAWSNFSKRGPVRSVLAVATLAWMRRMRQTRDAPAQGSASVFPSLPWTLFWLNNALYAVNSVCVNLQWGVIPGRTTPLILLQRVVHMRPAWLKVQSPALWFDNEKSWALLRPCYKQRTNPQNSSSSWGISLYLCAYLFHFFGFCVTNPGNWSSEKLLLPSKPVKPYG